MDKDVKLTEEEVALARKRRLEAMHLQRIEGNPFDAEDIALFEMFERERWSFEKRREFVAQKCRELSRNQSRGLHTNAAE